MDLKEFNTFLNKLEENKIFYKLDKVRSEALMVEVVVPGQRWEIEFLDDGTVEIEKFISDKDMYNARELEILFKEFSFIQFKYKKRFPNVTFGSLSTYS